MHRDGFADQDQADFIIIGAGSAGCALAYRLSEDPRNTVLVLEAGGTDKSMLIQMPAALSYPMNMGRYDWGFKSAPEPHLGGRQLAVPRGKVIGGSSSINGMVFVRGHRQDFNTWAQMGARGWSYDDVLPYFKRMETCSHGEDAYRGRTGPLKVGRGPGDGPLYEAFIQAGVEAGYARLDDYNGRSQEGFAPFDVTIDKGSRCSAARAYLAPARKRPNVRLITGALVDRILMDGGKAQSVIYRHKAGEKIATASREIIISASVINTPAILQRSGIGDSAQLQALGIAPAHHLPGVGQNLQDHLEVYVQRHCKQPVTLYKHWGLLSRLRIGVQWLLAKSGPGATSHIEAGGFVRSGPNVDYPDIQFHFLPIAARYDGKASVDGHGFQVHTGPMRSTSRGSVQIRSSNPRTPPGITFNYMSQPQDWVEFRRAIRLVRKIFSQPAFAPFVGDEITPGADQQSDAALDAFVREHVESAYHPCGTCRMGDASDPFAVVDPSAQVIGLEGLRVADSSIFPLITNGNINAPSIMVGEKIADHILGRI